MLDPALLSLIAAAIAFVGVHFALSHPLRAPLVTMMGEQAFQGVYSVLVLGSVVWMGLAFRASDAGAVVFPWGYTTPEWIAASVLSLLAMVLIVAASTPSNPTLAVPGAEDALVAEPVGALRVTRHPMMWGFALWALAHVIAAPTARTVVVASAVAFMALVGARALDLKKRRQFGQAWDGFARRTTFFPRLHRINAIPPIAWVIGSIVWLAASWLHEPLGGVAAGIWRWL